MTTQLQPRSDRPSQVPGDVPTLTLDQRHTIERAAELIVAADGIRTLTELLQVTPTPDELYPAAFGCTIRLLDEVVAVVDELVGNDGSAAISLVAGDK